MLEKKREDEHGTHPPAAAGLAPPIVVRPAGERFRTRTGWLDSRHTFSFGEHHDPKWVGLRDLLVVNDDRVEPGQGFATHRHRDMEILSYVLEGSLEHRDSMGTGSVIAPGDVQRMSAGSGVSHSEWNASATDRVHFLQIWIMPERNGIKPSYEQQRFSTEERRGKLRLVASRDGREGSVTIHQDAAVFAGLLERGERAAYRLEPGRHAWLHVARGDARVNGRALGEGDGAALGPGGLIEIAGEGAAEGLLFDLR